jgi:hypothetical protein
MRSSSMTAQPASWNMIASRTTSGSASGWRSSSRWAYQNDSGTWTSFLRARMYGRAASQAGA